MTTSVTRYDIPALEALLAEELETGEAATERKLARRGTTNRNDRGGSDTRRRRREWLVATYRADVDLAVLPGLEFAHQVPVLRDSEGGQMACRCYRCGILLTVETVTVDRIKPGCQGGTYRRDNIRPACGRCNSSTGATTRRKR